MDVRVFISPWKMDANSKKEVRDLDNTIKLAPYMENVIMQVGDKSFCIDAKELQAAVDICIRSMI